MSKNGFGRAGSGDKAMQQRWMAKNAQRLERMTEKKQNKSRPAGRQEGGMSHGSQA